MFKIIKFMSLTQISVLSLSYLNIFWCFIRGLCGLLIKACVDAFLTIWKEHRIDLVNRPRHLTDEALNKDRILARVFGFAVTINFELVDCTKLIMNKSGLNNIFEDENQL